MGIKQLYNDNLRKLPNEYGDVSVMNRDIDFLFLVLCQNKQNRKILTNSVTMLSTMFKMVAEKNTELQKKSLSSIWCTYLILVLNTVTIATTISYFLSYILLQQYCFIFI